MSIGLVFTFQKWLPCSAQRKCHLLGASLFIQIFGIYAYDPSFKIFSEQPAIVLLLNHIKTFAQTLHFGGTSIQSNRKLSKAMRLGSTLLTDFTFVLVVMT